MKIVREYTPYKLQRLVNLKMLPLNMNISKNKKVYIQNHVLIEQVDDKLPLDEYVKLLMNNMKTKLISSFGERVNSLILR